jgi:hypothetical protein
MTTKIELKSGFSTGYLPEGVTYKNYTMLVAIANYSENGSCVSTATGLLDEDNDIAKKRGTSGYYWWLYVSCWHVVTLRLRGTEQITRTGQALLKGLENLEIEL